MVENGSVDRTFDVAQAFANAHENFRVIQTERGKGAAVKRGMLEAKGEYRFMCDADLSMPVEEISKFIPPALADFDIAIASREIEGSARYNEPRYRHFGGRGINYIIQPCPARLERHAMRSFQMFSRRCCERDLPVATNALLVVRC